MTIFKEPKRKPLKTSLDDDQKRQLGDSKAFLVIAITLASFVIGGGWRLLFPGAIAEQFNVSASGASQTSAWLQFALTFGFLPALVGGIASAAIIDRLSHSKGNR